MTQNTNLHAIAEKIRLHAITATSTAGSGHPTSSLSIAEILSVLYFDILALDIQDPDAPGNDRLVLSKGHAAPALYGALYERGFLTDTSPETLRTFDSILEGHPTDRVPGVQIATGSLGQGLAVGLGMACGISMRGDSNNVYVICGDGEIAEGSVFESMHLAGKWQPENICCIVDVNRLGQSDPTLHQWNISEYSAIFKAMGWKTIQVDGHSISELQAACHHFETDGGPLAILAKTIKGKGVSFVENQEGRHGKAFNKEETEKAISEITARLSEAEDQESPTRRVAHVTRVEQKHFQIAPPTYQNDTPAATRDACADACVALRERDTSVVVLDGDVKNSTRMQAFFDTFPESAIECFIAEQTMTGIAAGLAIEGYTPFVATFSAFLTRAHDQLRMSAYSQSSFSVIGTHSGVSIGQDGPSQMGLEDIAMMRSLWGSIVLVPADAVSAFHLTTISAQYEGISYIRAMRGKTPVLYDNEETFVIGGSKVLRHSDNDQGIICACGGEVHMALAVAQSLAAEDIHLTVIDCYSVKPIDTGTIRLMAEKAHFLLTVEDHYQQGGFGEAIAAELSENIPVSIAAVTKHPHSGSAEKLLAEQGLDKKGLEIRIRTLIEKYVPQTIPV